MDIRDFIARIRQLADENGDRPMFVEDFRRVTRREFLDTACRVNARIRQVGTAGGFIPIVLPDSADYLAAEFGIWMSGNASVHLGDSFPRERIKYIVDECEAPFVIDGGFIRSSLQCAPDDTVAERAPDRDCVMFYTSGSTGSPKGVLHSDRGYMSGILRSAGTLGTTGDEVRGNIAPFYFIAVTLVMEGMYCGSLIDLMDHDTVTDVNKLSRHIIDHGITSVFMSPSLLSALDLSGLPLEKVMVASERASMVAPTDRCRIYNLYGQTEQAGQTLSFPIDKPYENTPVGKPSSGEIVPVIVDEQGNEVPQGEEGELCFRGITPCKYFKDPEKTASLMRGGMFHTGDIFRRLPSGDYLFVNRKDWMVKINGQRVEPGEVEAALRRIDGVAGAIVKGFDSVATRSRYLCAYYIPASEITEDEIRRALERTLPSYMVPAYFVRMDRFPVNANGKQDRKALQPPAVESVQAEYAAPTNEVERVLCESFAGVLNLDRVGINDDFYSLGGNSIHTMQMLKRCVSSGISLFGSLSTNLVYQGRTPGKIAELLSNIGERIKIQLDDYPLSGIQNFYFKFCMAAVGKPVFNVSELLELDPDVDLDRLAEAIRKAVANHAGLNVRLFVNDKGEVRQKYSPGQWELKVERMSSESFEEEKKNLVQPFLLLKDRLFRFRLIKTPEAGYLFFDIHHIIFDGASLTILFREIEQLYQGGGVEAEDWNSLEMSAEEYEVRQTEALPNARRWYRRTFGDVATVFRPDKAHAGSTILSEMKAGLNVPFGEVERFCSSSGITVNELVTAAYALTLGQYIHGEDVVFASAYNAREDDRVRNTVGLFARPLLVRASWNGRMRTTEFLKDMRSNLLACMNNSILSPDEMMEEIPLAPDYLFIYQGELMPEPVVGGKSSKAVKIAEKQAASAIECHLFHNRADGGFLLQVLYKKECFSKDMTERLVRNYEQSLTGLMKYETIADFGITETME